MAGHDSLPPEFEAARRAGVRRAYKQLAWWALAALVVLGALLVRTLVYLGEALTRPFGG